MSGSGETSAGSGAHFPPLHTLPCMMTGWRSVSTPAPWRLLIFWWQGGKMKLWLITFLRHDVKRCRILTLVRPQLEDELCGSVLGCLLCDALALLSNHYCAAWIYIHVYIYTLWDCTGSRQWTKQLLFLVWTPRVGGREGRFGHLFLWMFVTVSTFSFLFSDSARDHGNRRKCSERNDAGADFTLSELS